LAYWPPPPRPTFPIPSPPQTSANLAITFPTSDLFNSAALILFLADLAHRHSSALVSVSLSAPTYGTCSLFPSLLPSDPFGSQNASPFTYASLFDSSTSLDSASFINSPATASVPSSGPSNLSFAAANSHSGLSY